MVGDDLSHLVDHLRTRVGSDLRGVATYRPGSTKFVYLRDDLQTAYTEQRGRLGSLMSLLSETGGELVERSTDDSPLGRYRGGLHLTENAYALHFHTADDRGIVITLDRSVGDGVANVLSECETLLYD